MVRVDRFDVADVRDPKLEAALKRWFQLCGADGLYPRDKLGFGVLVGTPEIMNGRTTVIATDVQNPMNYVFAYYGGEFDIYDNKSFVARRLCDLPDRAPAEAIVRCYGEAIAERRPVGHRISATFAADTITYDRLVLPTVNRRSEIDRIVTVSVELSRQN